MLKAWIAKVDRDLFLIGLLITEAIVAFGIAFSASIIAQIVAMALLLATMIYTWIVWR